MYPPKVSDAQIRSLIATLSDGAQLPSGATLRTELAARFGSRGGVARIYELLNEMRTAGRRIPDPDSDRALRQQIQTLREQLQLQREREESDQSRWALEIDRLRLKVALLEPLAQQAQMLRETADLLRVRLQAADMRVSNMEEELLRMQEAAESHPRPL